MRKKQNIYFIVVLITLIAVEGNTPPIIHIERDIIVQEDDPVGSTVTTVHVSDNDNDDIKLSLSTAFGRNGEQYFSIDDFGRIRTMKSLEGLGGTDFFFQLKAVDGGIPAISEFRISVQNHRSLTAPGAKHKFDSTSRQGFFFNPSLQSTRPNIPVSFADSEVIRMTPPVLELPPSRLWRVPIGTPIGRVVDVVKVVDVSGSENFTFAIQSKKDILNIDPRYGVVTVRRSPRPEDIGDDIVIVRVTDKYGTAEADITLKIDSNTSITPINATVEYMDLNVEEDLQSGVIAIIKNGPTTTTSSSSEINLQDKNGRTSDANSSEGDTKVVVVVVPLLGLFAALAFFGFFCFRSRHKNKVTKEDSVMKFDKKSLEVTNTGNSSAASQALPHVKRLWGRRASANNYEEREQQCTINPPLKSINSTDSSSSLILEPPDEWEFPRHKLKVIGILGEGFFGQVWKYEAQDLNGTEKIIVAVKTLKESAGQQERNDLHQELKVLKMLGKHPNVVSLLACCTEKEPLLVVLEYLVNGKLQTYLRDRRSLTPYNNLYGTSTTLSPRDLTIFALQVAKGMEYLTSHGIVHRDLAARNVLVGENKICKVADFGFARDIANNHVYERKSDGRLPIRWMAVESLYDNIFTSKSDVWSFGVLLWEIVTLGSTPYPGMAAEDVMKKIRNGYRLEKPDYCRREIYNIMYYCWYEDAKDRPSFMELIKHLEDLITSEVDYIEINKFPERCYYNMSVAAASGELI